MRENQIKMHLDLSIESISKPTEYELTKAFVQIVECYNREGKY